MSLSSSADFIARLLNNKEFREAYVSEHIKTGIPFQIRAMRSDRDWTQAELGGRAKKKQHGISRLENPNLGDELSIRSLLEIASAFDVALLVKFVPFSRLLKEYEDTSPTVLSATSINDIKEGRLLKMWAAAKDKAQTIESNEKATPAQTVHPNVSAVSDAGMLFFDKPRGKKAKGSKARPPKRPKIESISSGADIINFPIAA